MKIVTHPRMKKYWNISPQSKCVTDMCVCMKTREQLSRQLIVGDRYVGVIRSFGDYGMELYPLMRLCLSQIYDIDGRTDF